MEDSVECLLMWPAQRCWDSTPPRVSRLRAGALLSPLRPTGSVTREMEGPLPREEENNFPAADLTPVSLEEGRSRSQRLQHFLEGDTEHSFKGNQTASHKPGTTREHRPRHRRTSLAPAPAPARACQAPGRAVTHRADSGLKNSQPRHGLQFVSVVSCGRDGEARGQRGEKRVLQTPEHPLPPSPVVTACLVSCGRLAVEEPGVETRAGGSPPRAGCGSLPQTIILGNSQHPYGAWARDGRQACRPESWFERQAGCRCVLGSRFWSQGLCSQTDSPAGGPD